MIAVVAINFLGLGSASAQPALQFRFSFEDTGTNVTSGPDGALGSTIVLNALNFAGTAVDIHGASARAFRKRARGWISVRVETPTHQFPRFPDQSR